MAKSLLVEFIMHTNDKAMKVSSSPQLRRLIALDIIRTTKKIIAKEAVITVVTFRLCRLSVLGTPQIGFVMFIKPSELTIDDS